MLFGNMSSRLLRQVTCAPRTCVSVGRRLVAAHVFVESNWLFGYLAPAHHQVRAAVELFDRAMRDEFTLHLPNMCIGKARQAIRSKCQPRTEANAGFFSGRLRQARGTQDSSAARTGARSSRRSWRAGRETTRAGSRALHPSLQARRRDVGPGDASCPARYRAEAVRSRNPGRDPGLRGTAVERMRGETQLLRGGLGPPALGQVRKMPNRRSLPRTIELILTRRRWRWSIGLRRF